jgi:hypothetical protein
VSVSLPVDALPLLARFAETEALSAQGSAEFFRRVKAAQSVHWRVAGGKFGSTGVKIEGCWGSKPQEGLLAREPQAALDP